MSIIDRAKNILLSPKTEWPVIAAEPATVQSVMSYAAVLMLLPMLGAILFTGVLGLGAFGAPMLGFVATTAVIGYVLGLALLYVVALIIDAVTPSFDGNKDIVGSLKLLTYAGTASWVAGFLSAIPVIGILIAIGAIGYVIYLIYLGSGPVKSVPDAKQFGYTAVVCVIYFVINLVVTGLIVGVIMAGVFGAIGMGAMGGAMGGISGY